jgi:hypothetical protein
MNNINVTKAEIEVAWDGRKLCTVIWVPYGEDPNVRPRVSVFEYLIPDNMDTLVVQPMSLTWLDTREVAQCPGVEAQLEVRDYAIRRIRDEIQEDDW